LSILGKIVTVLMLIASLAVGAMVVSLAKTGNDWYGPYQAAEDSRAQAVEAIKVLTGFGRPLAGRMLVFDAETNLYQQVELARDPNCPVCGSIRAASGSSRMR